MTSALPRILLVEDDPVSRAFLAAALQALPATVDAADSMAAASALAAAHRYDLWLFDSNLPDGSGAELLAHLRKRDDHTPALAHTAANEAAIAEALKRAGFRDVLVKPLPATAVQAAMRRALGLAIGESAPALAAGPDLRIWDDEAASRALNGNREHITTLRELFLTELAAVQARVTNAFHNKNFAGLHVELHRLRASCGFVGAARLGAAAQALHEDNRSVERLQGFDAAAREILEQTQRH
jgi:CheY-like chemotaxis protein/HPt (histidine-containing phosphotransfer) domain-containing protein